MNFVEKNEIYLKKRINLTEYYNADQIRFIIKHNLIDLAESQVYRAYKAGKYKKFKDNFFVFLKNHIDLWDKEIFKLKGTCLTMIFITTKLDKYLSESINKNWKYHTNWHPSWWGLPMDDRLDKIIEINHHGAVMRFLAEKYNLNEDCLPVDMSEKDALTFKSYVEDFGPDLANVPGFISHNIMGWN